jgi:hypothetical protein
VARVRSTIATRSDSDVSDDGPLISPLDYRGGLHVHRIAGCIARCDRAGGSQLKPPSNITYSSSHTAPRTAKHESALSPSGGLSCERAPDSTAGMPAARHAMYFLFCNAYGLNILLRFAVGFLVPFAVESMSFTASQSAMLQGSFFPGYVIAMMPAALVTRAIGEKAAVSINLFGSGALCLLMPLAARLGALPLAAVFSLMGVMQGCIVPCIIALQTRWIPKEGIEKVWATRMVSLSLVIWQMFASFVTPRLSGRRGFAVTARVYSVLLLSWGVVWALWSKNHPKDWSSWPRMLPAEKALLNVDAAPPAASTDAGAGGGQPAAAAADKPTKSLTLRELLSVGSARAVICAAGGFGAASYAIMPIAPTYYQQELHVNAEQASSHSPRPALTRRPALQPKRL